MAAIYLSNNFLDFRCRIVLTQAETKSAPTKTAIPSSRFPGAIARMTFGEEFVCMEEKPLFKGDCLLINGIG